MIKGHPVGTLCLILGTPREDINGKQCTVMSEAYIAGGRGERCYPDLLGEIVQEIDIPDVPLPDKAIPPRYLLPIGHDPDSLDTPEETPKETPRELEEVQP